MQYIPQKASIIVKNTLLMREYEYETYIHWWLILVRWFTMLYQCFDHWCRWINAIYIFKYFGFILLPWYILLVKYCVTKAAAPATSTANLLRSECFEKLSSFFPFALINSWMFDESGCDMLLISSELPEAVFKWDSWVDNNDSQTEISFLADP